MRYIRITLFTAKVKYTAKVFLSANILRHSYVTAQIFYGSHTLYTAGKSCATTLILAGFMCILSASED